MKSGPLSGLKVVEFGAIGPVPFCATMLADMGADVVQIARPDARLDPDDVMMRGRRAFALDLKQPEGRDAALDLVERADILLEGNRPGVMEQLGLGPDACLARNPRLVYGRMTGWGQTGPLAARAGHDINYISLTGALAAIGQAGGAPVPPLNLVGDYGGGAMFLAFGVLCGHLESRTSGKGQVVDAAMVDGSAMLMALFCRMTAQRRWVPERGSNMLDGGAPWYTTYATADNRYVAVGALEEPFWNVLLERLDIAPQSLPPRGERSGWGVIREALAARFARKTRDQWAALFDDTDACVSPVLDLDEAAGHAHIASRGTFIELNGTTQPAPAPRFGRTPGEARSAACGPGMAAQVFASWGVPPRAVQ
ncbi:MULTISPECIES: CaiB/BaiF CoA-transferase family protein [unclassified Paraburkholderia]|uniref:CaiB/BaiF CoA transferase family protein n=1 Tax=unclassified Paraburkholderia TaxID=2615204 RepID=UPI002AB2FC26|nr:MULTISPECIES: CaiB/BaiF CoA-transferase family protein [unclassified Paraburkholderia]